MDSVEVSQAVRTVRARGATSVLIAADPTDTPKHLYARLGFRPVVVTRSLVAPG